MNLLPRNPPASLRKLPALLVLVVATFGPAPAGLAASTNLTWQAVGISEFMATNDGSVLDADGDPSPWIEIFNPTVNDVNLSGWSLTADPNNLRQWLFPNVTLLDPDDSNGSDNYLVVFASGKNRAVNTNELHTNFRLPVSGGFLALVDNHTNIVSVFTNYPGQTRGVSYGADLFNPNFAGYFPDPTPGEANVAGGAGAAPAVIFSRTGGTFLSTFSLQFSTASNNATIRYTLNGDPPTSDSPAYSNPIPITSSMQVRARAFGAGLMPGPMHSETFLLLDAGLARTNSNLPAVVLYDFGVANIPTDDTVGATDQLVNVSIYEPVNGVTSLTNAPTLTARAGFHIHGSSTESLPKHAFSVEFWDDADNSADYSPLGLPPESDFVLYAPDNFEPVLIHNPLIYQLSNEIGRYAPRTRLVEVYLVTSTGPVAAAHYNGIYVLEEKIKWDDNRVAIEKIHSVDTLHPLDNSPPNITGGYVMKIDRLGPGENGFNSANQTIAYDEPKEFDIGTPQRVPQQQYLQNYMDAFGNALYGAGYTNRTTGFRAFIDQPAALDHHILNVVAFNVDALRLSAFFYKPRTNALVFGPIWDFDRSQGSTDGRDYSPLYWRAPNGDLGTDFFNYVWWGRMFTDLDFWQAWIDRYEELRAGVLSTNHIFGDIDALVAQVQAEAPREAARWPSLTTPRSGTVAISGYSYTFPGTYQGEVNFLKTWYADRLNFMDTNFIAKPVFSNTNGAILPGGSLRLSGAGGATIYYTTNGTDPRAAGGGMASNALVYTSAIALTTNITITARAYNASHHNLTGANNPPLSSPWSGLAAEAFAPAAAPVITQAPASLSAYVGQSPVFTVQATGTPAPAYQWQFNGANLTSQTNAQLALLNVQTNQAGAYSVGVTNLAGGANVSWVLTVTPKPNLVITEVMSSEAKGSLATSDWWELSNFGTFAVNLQGWRFDDDHDSFADADTLTNAVSIAPGESIVLVEDLTPASFRTWWGTNLPAGLQIITYPSIGFSSSGDMIYLWNAAATSVTDTVASVTFSTAAKGVSFGYDPAGKVFGGLSAAGQNGAFIAALNGDIGSPGMILNRPRFTQTSFTPATGFSLGFVTQPNLNYRVEYKDDLAAPTWNLLTNFTATASLFTVTDSNTNAARFYRVVFIP